MKFRALVLELYFPQNLWHTHTDTQTDRYFPEIFKSCSGNAKTCKSIKNWKSKIFTKPTLSSSDIEKSKKYIKDFNLVLNVNITNLKKEL